MVCLMRTLRNVFIKNSAQGNLANSIVMAFHTMNEAYDVYDDDSLSDNDGNDTSSEDEIDIILHGTPEQRRKLQHLHNKQKQVKEGRLLGEQAGNLQGDSSSEDEFEKEMNAELNQHVKFLEDSRGRPALEGSSGTQPSGSGSSQGATTAADKKKNKDNTQDEFYDEIYFDSDEEEESATSTKASRKKKRSVISNDDLLYDPDMDDEDQRWVDQQRQSHRSHPAGARRGGKKAKMPNSDALLDCPACMTTLCIDCQRHETYKHQYRAMFVMNCTVDTSETLQCPEQAPKKKKKKKKTSEAMEVTEQGDSTSKDLFNPVRCTECNTVVGVIDHDEVYHFFNVLASYT